MTAARAHGRRLLRRAILRKVFRLRGEGGKTRARAASIEPSLPLAPTALRIRDVWRRPHPLRNGQPVRRTESSHAPGLVRARFHFVGLREGEPPIVRPSSGRRRLFPRVFLQIGHWHSCGIAHPKKRFIRCAHKSSEDVRERVASSLEEIRPPLPSLVAEEIVQRVGAVE